MKICKNDSNIILYPVTKCSQCVLKTSTRPCLWIRIVSTRFSLACGGIIQGTISDIFKL